MDIYAVEREEIQNLLKTTQRTNKAQLIKKFESLWKTVLEYVDSKWSENNETEIETWLKQLDVVFETRNRKILSPKELDFYFSNHNFAIEFQGDWFHCNPKMFDENYTHPKLGLAKKHMEERFLEKDRVCRTKHRTAPNLGI